MKTGNNPAKVLRAVSKKNAFLEDMEKILHKELSFTSIRLTDSNVMAESPNWFDITIEPVLNRANTTYHFSLIFRNKEKKVVETKIKDLTSFKQSVFEKLESHLN